MVDLFKTETVNETVNSDILIDETMSIVTADENFEVISGNNALFVYTRYIHPDDVSRFTEALKDYAESGKFIVVRMLYQTGEYHWMLTRITDGGVSETRGHVYDINIMDAALITAQIDNLNSQIERYSSYLGMCENVLFSYDILNDDFNIFMTSDGHQTMSFYHGTLNAWEEDKIKTDVLGLNEVKELDGFCKALANGEKLFKREININILNKPGRLDKCLARGNTIVDAYGNRIVIGTIIILESSDNHVVEELNIISDMKDPGTDLLNKRAITDYVRKLIDSQPGHTVTIAIIDIDDFKTINDTYGHMFGDEVLCKVADILRDAVGSRGLCGRIGGDEMFIIMEGLNDNEGIRNVLRTIRNNTKWLYHDDPRNIKITCSIGSATYPNDAKRYDELFKIEVLRQRLMRPQFIALGLTVGQGQPRILKELLFEGSMTQKKLADACLLDVTTMSRTLDRMEQAGLLVRESNPDCRRSWLIALTEKGMDIAKKVQQIFEETDKIYCSNLSEKEAGIFSYMFFFYKG